MTADEAHKLQLATDALAAVVAASNLVRGYGCPPGISVHAWNRVLAGLDAATVEMREELRRYAAQIKEKT
jgi:hypothetical protein